MKRIIVNADDCGMSLQVNEHIEKAILARKISSTTVMANMDDFDGAVKLYKQYKDRISFGWHINLTEGEPLLESQLLLDKGYYVEQDGRIVFNGKAFWKKHLTNEMKMAIRKELIAQYEKLRDSGILISHADSHHHIHTSPSMLTIVPSVLKETGIQKVRRMRNNVPGLFKRIPRNVWGWMYKLQNCNLTMTDAFGYFIDYATSKIFVKGNTMELECHPGHPKHMEEEKLLMSQNYDNDIQLISYLDL